jgi:thiamine transport system ATP-binding protein
MLEINQLVIQLGDNTLKYQRTIEEGEIVTLQGLSGVGKSSLLLCIAGFVKAQSGTICWCGEALNPLASEQRPIAMLFQESNLFEHISVLKNALLGTQGLAEETLMNAADALQIRDQMDKMPTQLSGGQRQRVGLLRTLLRPEPIILLDEPFAELDNHSREIATQWVADMAKAHNKTVLLVTHQQEDVDKLAASNWLIG